MVNVLAKVRLGRLGRPRRPRGATRLAHGRQQRVNPRGKGEAFIHGPQFRASYWK